MYYIILVILIKVYMYLESVPTIVHFSVVYTFSLWYSLHCAWNIAQTKPHLPKIPKRLTASQPHFYRIYSYSTGLVPTKIHMVKFSRNI